jgi:hypothetical protein
MLSRPIRVVLAVVVALGVLAPGQVLADGPLNVRLRLGSRCVTGHKPADTPVTVRLLRSDGKVLETRRDETSDLDWSVCFVRHTPVKGNRIQLDHGSFDRNVRVPDLTIALDRVTNVVRGHAPAGRTIELAYAACDSDGICLKSPPVMVAADSRGRYRKDLSPSIDIDGSDIVRVGRRSSNDDYFYRVGRAPWMTITRPDRFTLSCLPTGTTTLRLLSATGALRAIKAFRTERTCRTFDGRFRRNGHAVNIRKGDRITSSFANDARMVWPSPSVVVSGATYSGRCFANADWHLTIGPGGSIATYSGPTDDEGRFLVVGYQIIPSGASLRLTCESIRGDRVVVSGKAS